MSIRARLGLTALGVLRFDPSISGAATTAHANFVHLDQRGGLKRGLLGFASCKEGP